MSAQILSGRDVAVVVRAEVAERVAALKARGKNVGLATVLVGDDPASHIYVRNKHRAADKAGMISVDVNLPSDVSQADVIAAVHALNADDRVDGMIVQLPLPNGLDGNAAVAAVDPTKDADGLHPYNLGLLVLDRPGPRPATPVGILRILKHYDIQTTGQRAVVIGRSFLVGRPMAIMLGTKGVDCTVVQAHSRTPDLAAVTLEADIIVVAAGVPNLLRREHVKPGAVVIDVGTNRVNDKLVGDIDFEGVSLVAGGVTPVPGGVGPMTIASLLANTVEAAEKAFGDA